ncbi:monovalent cation:proton antiporter-2 (CPA2) family protein [Horticoccus luteus]|uniref:Monovalent cation:proton antiporter-2 (CPA2) family protein n=1 Tax=Horticoccus luteus TaxID=2862869 RepID=A0A8F9TTK6_9BACT|nr:monovalent cation:proton antiporter-2 (CPA2) family protein [Horticoccus luteus]QYM77538.1 monovalent cation:proton antiporter-2 (CPA2) family protein [Horticoccus luteus]
MNSFLLHALIYLLAAVIAVPIAKRFGFGSVLGYLLAGVLIGPHALNLVGEQTGDVMHFAEFGVVMMLFLVGLELQPSRLWGMRLQLLGLGGLQVLLTAAALAAAGLAFGVDARVALAGGFILAMSSTAIVLQSLQERGQLATPPGQAAFAVLLFQDLAVLPILAFLPLLAPRAEQVAAVPGAQPAWQQTCLVLLAVAAVILGGRYIVNPLFRAIARTGLRELFTAAALLLVVATSLLMQSVGLSAALGTFLAGVVLANSEYRHELEADIEPFKGLLLGLFFITVGANIDLGLLRVQPLTIAGLVAALLLVKFVVLFALARAFRLSTPAAFTFGFALAQGGEFAFVLLAFAVDHHALAFATASPLVAAVALSMAVSPLLFLLNEKFVQPRFAVVSPRRADDTIDASAQENPVIIAGFGRFGHVIGRLLRANNIGATVLDLDAGQVEIVRRLGIKVFYGDATRLDLLHAAGAARARAIVIAIDDERKAVQLAETVQHHFPRLKIFARAVGRVHAFEYQKRGIMGFYRETLGTSLDLGVDLMQELGLAPAHARRAAALFKEHDERSVRELARYWDDAEAYFSHARAHIAAFERMFASDTPSALAVASAERPPPAPGEPSPAPGEPSRDPGVAPDVAT